MKTRISSEVINGLTDKAALNFPSGVFKEPAMGTWVSLPSLSTRTLAGNLQSDPPDWNFPNWSSQPVTPLLLKALGT